jgi:hypothetical protein
VRHMLHTALNLQSGIHRTDLLCACFVACAMQASTAPWVATTWLHNMPAGQDDPLGLAAECTDNNEQCRWAVTVD